MTSVFLPHHYFSLAYRIFQVADVCLCVSMLCHTFLPSCSSILFCNFNVGIFPQCCIAVPAYLKHLHELNELVWGRFIVFDKWAVLGCSY